VRRATGRRLVKREVRFVGLVPDMPGEQADVNLCHGDLPVIYTDGFSEARSPILEEWGERRLINAVSFCSGLPAKDAIQYIIQATDAFAFGAPQSDDTTLVVLRAV
jgi:phosphoserine phosphatase RsbU/P